MLLEENQSNIYSLKYHEFTDIITTFPDIHNIVISRETLKGLGERLLSHLAENKFIYASENLSKHISNQYDCKTLLLLLHMLLKNNNFAHRISFVAEDLSFHIRSKLNIDKYNFFYEFSFDPTNTYLIPNCEFLHPEGLQSHKEIGVLTQDSNETDIIGLMETLDIRRDSISNLHII